MKLTLFTISNEQIKEQLTKANEQLSKLQTKVESLETVKDIQDKIISAKDSQITFLQGEVSTIITWGSIGIAVITALATVIYSYIKSLEEKAKEKIEEAENTLQTATKQLAEIETARKKTETNLAESDKKIVQLNSLIDESNNIATIAQEKIEELEEKQKRDMSIRQISITLDLSKNIIDTIFEHIKEPISLKLTEEQLRQFSKLNNEYKSMVKAYRGLSFDFNSEVISGKRFDSEYLVVGVPNLVKRISNLYGECLKLRRELNIYE